MRTLAFARSAASHRRMPSASECAIGFSTSTATPASMHCSACSTCSGLGVASTTPSGLSFANIAASDSYSGTPNRLAVSTAFGDTSTMPDSTLPWLLLDFLGAAQADEAGTGHRQADPVHGR